MGLLIHYHTAGKETIVPVTKRARVADAARVTDAAWVAIEKKMVKTFDASATEVSAFIGRCRAKGRTPVQVQGAIRRLTADATPSAEVRAFIAKTLEKPKDDHPEGCRCNECKMWWGRDSAADSAASRISELREQAAALNKSGGAEQERRAAELNRKADGIEAESRGQRGVTSDAEPVRLDEHNDLRLKVRAAGDALRSAKTPSEEREATIALKRAEANLAQAQKTGDAESDGEEREKVTDSALELGRPVNREYLRMEKTHPGDKDVRAKLAAKFTEAQMSAWAALF